MNFTAREAALLVALGRHAIDMRLLPFTDTLESGLDKVRAALSTSAQRELLDAAQGALLPGRALALPSKKAVRAAIERAWFEQQPLRITYVDGNFVQTDARRPHHSRSSWSAARPASMPSTSTTGERRHFRLDRIASASLVPTETRPSPSRAPTRPGG